LINKKRDLKVILKTNRNTPNLRETQKNYRIHPIWKRKSGNLNKIEGKD
jgi:hypothetical protein